MQKQLYYLKNNNEIKTTAKENWNERNERQIKDEERNQRQS